MICKIIGGGRRAAARWGPPPRRPPPAPAVAGSFRIDPVNLVVPHGRSSAELRLTNLAGSAAAVRVTALRWTQRDGADLYETTSDIIASPPMFAVAPGGSQLIRFGFRRRVPGAAYRINVEEIPGPAAQGTGIRVALKIDLPLYVGTEENAPPRLVWALQRAADGAFVAESRNEGGTPAQVSSVEALDQAGRRLARSVERGVVLPGSMRRWRLGRAGGQAATIIVTTPSGEQRIAVGGTRS
jgi:fimbrial chaperone protein